jgi:hypothetical protein
VNPTWLDPQNRYLTNDEIMNAVARMWKEIDLDPFWDPEQSWSANYVFDARRGEDAYAIDWTSPLDRLPVRALVNGPYSAAAKTAERIAGQLRVYGRHALHVISICPAAPGSDYWRRHVWPYASAVAWLGRAAFPAAVDIVDGAGSLVCAAGEIKTGNRTEIAALYYGSEAPLFRDAFSAWPVLRWDRGVCGP